eukprot:1027787-Pelagomonas_calceolata.AAC.1
MVATLEDKQGSSFGEFWHFTGQGPKAKYPGQEGGFVRYKGVMTERVQALAKDAVSCSHSLTCCSCCMGGGGKPVYPRDVASCLCLRSGLNVHCCVHCFLLNLMPVYDTLAMPFLSANSGALCNALTVIKTQQPLIVSCSGLLRQQWVGVWRSRMYGLKYQTTSVNEFSEQDMEQMRKDASLQGA